MNKSVECNYSAAIISKSVSTEFSIFTGSEYILFKYISDFKLTFLHSNCVEKKCYSWVSKCRMSINFIHELLMRLKWRLIWRAFCGAIFKWFLSSEASKMAHFAREFSNYFCHPRYLKFMKNLWPFFILFEEWTLEKYLMFGKKLETFFCCASILKLSLYGGCYKFWNKMRSRTGHYRSTRERKAVVSRVVGSSKENQRNKRVTRLPISPGNHSSFLARVFDIQTWETRVSRVPQKLLDMLILDASQHPVLHPRASGFPHPFLENFNVFPQ